MKMHVCYIHSESNADMEKMFLLLNISFVRKQHPSF